MSGHSRGTILQVAVPSPLRRAFDYLPLIEASDADALTPVGSRIRVPFGRRSCVGVVVGHANSTPVPKAKLRRALEVLDSAPILPPAAMELLLWASQYFHHPIGDVVLGALPGILRRGRDPSARGAEHWRLTPAGREIDPASLSRAPRQAEALQRLSRTLEGLAAIELGTKAGNGRSALAAMARKGWVEKVPAADRAASIHSHNLIPQAGETLLDPAARDLNESQRVAIASVTTTLGRFAPFLLDGVTGSGKTEVYLSLIAQVVQAGGQALVLIPEIGLTPQIVARFRARIEAPVAVLHSGLTEGERARSWLLARNGTAQVVIGTRSSVFVPLPRLGIIIVDEEHDLSFKQQDGFRYSARDLAVVRARQASVPVILGSATPSMETLQNVVRARYQELRLPHRAGGAVSPTLRIVDLRGQPCEEGLSGELRRAISDNLARGEQSLLFINRRGYAPVLICRDCGWHADCARCDSNLVYHRLIGRLRCHHCGHDARIPASCPSCQAERLEAFGLGTQRVSEAIASTFPAARVERIDRDRVRRKGTFEQLLAEIHAGTIDILVGTQMLAKGHHFPGVTLVGVLDGDSGLFGADFRAPERMAQLLVQVAGRAGRGDKPGQVLIQTHHPHHPLLRRLTREGYRAFSEATLIERESAALPPFSSNALLRAEAVQPELAQLFLERARDLAQALVASDVQLLGPVPAPMERRAGRFRAHLLVEAPSRASIQQLLVHWLAALEGLAEGRKVRWSIDVDPQEMM